MERSQLEANIIPISEKHMRLEHHYAATSSRIALNDIGLITRAIIT